MKGLLTVVFSLLLISASAQKKYCSFIGAGVSFGASNYIGDLDKRLTLDYMQPAFGAHLMYNFQPRMAFRLTYFQGKVVAKDQDPARNLNFQSPVSELGLQLMYKLFTKHGELGRPVFTPYVFAGAALFRYNPTTDLNGEQVELQPIGTEGQNLGDGYPEPYNLTQLAIPMGAGFLVKLNKRFDIGLETGFRKTFTDYIDDVSGKYPDQVLLYETNPTSAALSNRSGAAVRAGDMRGNPDNTDWYVYTNISLTYYFYSSNKRTPGMIERCFTFE